MQYTKINTNAQLLMVIVQGLLRAIQATVPSVLTSSHIRPFKQGVRAWIDWGGAGDDLLLRAAASFGLKATLANEEDVTVNGVYIQLQNMGVEEPAPPVQRFALVGVFERRATQFRPNGADMPFIDFPEPLVEQAHVVVEKDEPGGGYVFSEYIPEEALTKVRPDWTTRGHSYDANHPLGTVYWSWPNLVNQYIIPIGPEQQPAEDDLPF